VLARTSERASNRNPRVVVAVVVVVIIVHAIEVLFRSPTLHEEEQPHLKLVLVARGKRETKTDIHRLRVPR
jgi:hypothetical protein